MRSSRSERLERLDSGSYRDLDELRGNLRDMAEYDRRLGAFADVIRAANLAGAHTALDVGVGNATFIGQARQHAPHVRWSALDLSQDVLRIAGERERHLPRVCGRAQHLPFADGAFDVVTCANTLHHLDGQGAIALMQECARVARQRIVIVDLARNQLTLAGAWLLTRLTSRNPLTLADGVLSARKAFTAAEVRVLASQAAINLRVRQTMPFRFVAVCDLERA